MILQRYGFLLGEQKTQAISYRIFFQIDASCYTRGKWTRKIGDDMTIRNVCTFFFSFDFLFLFVFSGSIVCMVLFVESETKNSHSVFNGESKTGNPRTDAMEFHRIHKTPGEFRSLHDASSL